MPDFIHPSEGRTLFGADSANYEQARPEYPEEVYGFLGTCGALSRDRATLEIGAGSGLATRRLLELGVNPLTVIEPDARFAPMLQAVAAPFAADFELMQCSFEEAELDPASYDLIVAATSFHWVDRSDGMAKAARLLRSGGHLALWWNVFGDDTRADPFHEATHTILRDLRTSPSGAPEEVPFALDVDARLAAFAAIRAFSTPAYALYRWTLALTTEQVGALYGTFSSINALPADAARAILDRLMEVAEEQFAGRVERNMISVVYVAQKDNRKQDGPKEGDLS